MEPVGSGCWDKLVQRHPLVLAVPNQLDRDEMRRKLDVDETNHVAIFVLILANSSAELMSASGEGFSELDRKRISVLQKGGVFQKAWFNQVTRDASVDASVRAAAEELSIHAHNLVLVPMVIGDANAHDNSIGGIDQYVSVKTGIAPIGPMVHTNMKLIPVHGVSSSSLLHTKAQRAHKARPNTDKYPLPVFDPATSPIIARGSKLEGIEVGFWYIQEVHKAVKGGAFMFKATMYEKRYCVSFYDKYGERIGEFSLLGYIHAIQHVHTQAISGAQEYLVIHIKGIKSALFLKRTDGFMSLRYTEEGGFKGVDPFCSANLSPAQLMSVRRVHVSQVPRDQREDGLRDFDCGISGF